MKEIAQLHKLYLQSKGICTDTRAITPNSLFFALKGSSFNGNQFAKNAIEKKASYAIIDEPEYARGDKYILVNNVLETLQELANFHRKWLNIPIIGITGTNGKTTTKELINTVLSRKFKTFATQGNFNNHIGVPLTILSMDKNTEIGIIEMGANHPGEIAELCLIAEPDYGIITNVGKAHLEGFGSFEGVKKTKAELYHFIENKKGTLFINSQNEHLKSMLNEGASIILYGNHANDLVKLSQIQNSEFLNLDATIKDHTYTFSTQLIGNYNAENALAAICIGTYFGVSITDIQKALFEYIPSNNRSQLINTQRNKLLLDAYNANPSSMSVAISNFASLDHNNKWVVLGEMKELGEISNKEHRNILDLVSKFKFKNVLLLGNSYSQQLSTKDNVQCFKTIDQLKDALKEHHISDAFILIKGSRSNKLEQITELL